MSTDPIKVGDILDGKYVIEGTLGEGAMGVVFSARHSALNKLVAIKTLRPEIAQDAGLVGRFEQEARAASAIGHPNIIEIFDLGVTASGARYMVMEQLSGLSLGDVLEPQPVQRPERIGLLLGQVLSALSAAHRSGIVHRDLKPENVFVVQSEERPETVKLLDFGISKVLAEVADPRIAGADSPGRATRVGMVLGTPLYMSPEQARGLLDIDHRVDLWAVGVVLYEMLTGLPPYDGENYNQILGAILQGDYDHPRTVNPRVSPELEAVVVRALAYERKDRFQSAAEFRDSLQRAIRGEPVQIARKPATRSAATAVLPAPSAPKPAAAANTAPAPAAPATGLAAATKSSDSRAAEAEMLSALDRIGTAAELSLGGTHETSGPTAGDEPGLAPPAKQAASALRSAAAAPAMNAPHQAAVERAPNSTVPADRFAPPSIDDEQGLVLDVAAVGPAFARRTQAAEKDSKHGARARASMAVPVQTASSAGGFIGLVKMVLALAILGAVGLAGYRYVTLGYVLEPPAVAEIAIGIEVEPADAEVTVDGVPHTKPQVKLTPGTSRQLHAMSPGRLSLDQKLFVPAQPDGEVAQMPRQLRIYLPHRLRLFSLFLAPTKTAASAVPSQVSNAALDQALAKLTRYADCIGPAGKALEDMRQAYTEKLRHRNRTRGRMSQIQRNTIPTFVPLPIEVLASCRVVAQSAGADPPAMAALDDGVPAFMDHLDGLNRLAAELGSYYSEEKYRSDNLRWGRKMHPVIMAKFAAIAEAQARVATDTANGLVTWQQRELETIEKRGGRDVQWQLRRLALALQGLVAAIIRRASEKRLASRSGEFLDAHKDAMEYMATHPDEMSAIEGAGIFITKVGALVKLVEGGAYVAAVSGVALEDLLRQYKESIQAFNVMVL